MFANFQFATVKNEVFHMCQNYCFGNRQKIVDFLGIPIKDWEV